MDPLSLVIGYTAGAASVVFVLALFRLLLPWRRAVMHATHVSVAHIIGMLLRGHPPGLIVDALITLRAQGARDITVHDVETVYTIHRHEIRDAESLVQLVQKDQPNREALRR